MVQMVKNMPAMQETQVRSLGQEDPLEKKEISTREDLLEKATRSRTLPGESHEQRSLVGTVHGVSQSRTQLRD